MLKSERPLLGMSLMVLGIAFLVSKDGIAKYLTADYSAATLLWIQYVSTWLILAPVIVFLHGWKSLWPHPFGAQLLRGLFAFATVLLFFEAVKTIPLAEAHAMVFVGPLTATALAPVFLDERVGWRRWLAVAVGFLGVLLILRPEFSGERTAYFLALGSGFSIGGFFIMNRKTAHSAPPLASVAHSVIFGTILLIPYLMTTQSSGTVEEGSGFAMLHFLGFVILALLGQTLLILSFSFATASNVAVFHYSGIIFSTIIGYFAFGEFPTLVSWIGILLVVGCGLFIAWREHVARKVIQPGKSGSD
ncbi:MAG: DMT family transporter [Methyloligellaceae bacterium]